MEGNVQYNLFFQTDYYGTPNTEIATFEKVTTLNGFGSLNAGIYNQYTFDFTNLTTTTYVRIIMFTQLARTSPANTNYVNITRWSNLP